MPDHSAEIATLTAALASGTRRVRFKDREVEYRTLQEIREAIDYLRGQQTPRTMGRFTTFSRGNGC